MKTILPIIVFLLTSISTSAQVFKLEASNPAPRVGEKVTISFRIEKETNQNENGKNALASLLNGGRNVIGEGQFEISSWFLEDMGPIPVGPFQISIDNTVYTTNRIILNVQGKLPDDILDGVWVRFATLDSVNFIILEQRAPATELRTKRENTMTWSMSAPDMEWVTINGEKLRQKGIYIEEKSSSSSMQMLAQGGNVAYKLTIYTYEIGTSFKGKFRIEKDIMNHLPVNGYFERR